MADRVTVEEIIPLVEARSRSPGIAKVGRT
jgi:hypothetical protein